MTRSMYVSINTRMRRRTTLLIANGEATIWGYKISSASEGSGRLRRLSSKDLKWATLELHKREEQILTSAEGYGSRAKVTRAKWDINASETDRSEATFDDNKTLGLQPFKNTIVAGVKCPSLTFARLNFSISGGLLVRAHTLVMETFMRADLATRQTPSRIPIASPKNRISNHVATREIVNAPALHKF